MEFLGMKLFSADNLLSYALIFFIGFIVLTVGGAILSLFCGADDDKSQCVGIRVLYMSLIIPTALKLMSSRKYSEEHTGAMELLIYLGILFAVTSIWMAKIKNDEKKKAESDRKFWAEETSRRKQIRDDILGKSSGNSPELAKAEREYLEAREYFEAATFKAFNK